MKLFMYHEIPGNYSIDARWGRKGYKSLGSDENA